MLLHVGLIATSVTGAQTPRNPQQGLLEALRGNRLPL